MNEQPIFDMRDFGAVCDSIHDDAPALQAALDAAKEAGGGLVRVHSCYLGRPVTIDSGLTITMGDKVVLAGEET